jgi:hypothetical protein
MYNEGGGVEEGVIIIVSLVNVSKFYFCANLAGCASLHLLYMYFEDETNHVFIKILMLLWYIEARSIMPRLKSPFDYKNVLNYII